MEVKKAEFVISSPDVKKCPAPDRHEYAFIGRSNVGKSSLINMLANRKDLAKTAAKPGKTQFDKPFFDERGVVYGGFAGVWLCPDFEVVARDI